MIMLLITYTVRIISFTYLILEFTSSITSDLIVFIEYVKHLYGIKVKTKKIIYTQNSFALLISPLG